MKNFRVKAVLALLAAALSCTPEGLETVPSATVSDGPVTVGFAVASDAAATKTAAGPDGLSTSWTSSDAIALWAKSGTAYSLSAVPFSIYSRADAGAFFTAELDSPMAQGTYTYYATYPVPSSVSGNTATFTVPSLQDGISGNGEDIMVASPAEAGALEQIDWLETRQPELALRMEHKLHRLRFYYDDSRLGGESIQKIVATFPKYVAGTVTTDFTDPESSMTITEGQSVITVEPVTPVAPSPDDERHYAMASIIPTQFQSGESMSVKLYTESKVAAATIPLQSRYFAAGHSTPVRIIPSSVGNFCKIYVNVDSNNLGENVQTITFTAPSGCKWSDSGSETFVYNPGTAIDAGHSFVLEYEDESAFRTLSGKTVTVTYDSEHVTISETIAIENLTGKYSTRLGLNVPYLLYEDFAKVSSFSNHDKYTGGSNATAGLAAAEEFLDGWSGGRIGAEAGKCIRIACRRETSARYDARVDSAPLRGTIKKSANLLVEFDYGANNEYGGIPIVSEGNVGQTCHIGYVTSTKAYKSGADDGTFEGDNSFYVKEYTGSYDSTPNNDNYTIHSVPSGKTIRVTWRTVVEDNADLTNTTAWLYLDNIKIKIAN